MNKAQLIAEMKSFKEHFEYENRLQPSPYTRGRINGIKLCILIVTEEIFLPGE